MVGLPLTSLALGTALSIVDRAFPTLLGLPLLPLLILLEGSVGRRMVGDLVRHDVARRARPVSLAARKRLRRQPQFCRRLLRILGLLVVVLLVARSLLGRGLARE